MEVNNSSNYDDTEPGFANGSDGNRYFNYYYYYYGNLEPFNIFDFLPESYKNARLFLYKYLVFIIWIVSFLGNTLVFLVLMKKRNRRFSTSIYLKGLAFADLSLNTSNTLILYFMSHGYIKPPTSDFDCRYRNVFSFAIAYIATWMLVVISLERVISVWMPYNVKRLCTENRAYIIIVFMWVTFIGLAFLHESLMEFDYQLGCRVNLEYSDFYHDYLSWVLISIQFLIPYAIIFISTAIIMVTLVNRKIRKHSTETKKRGTSVNIVLISVNIVFIFTKSPYIFFYLFAEYGTLHSNPLLSVAYYYFWFVYLQILNDCNSAVNVFVYFLVGSRFRADVKELLFGCCEKSRICMSGETQGNLKTRDTILWSTESKVDGNASAVEKVLRRQNSEFTL